MSLVLPVDHGSSDVWDVVLDAVFALVDAHDHSTGKGVKVVSSGLGINADVTWAGFALTAAKGIAFTEQAASAVSSYSDLLFVNSADHNLYFRNQGGTNVQVTSGNTLNVSIVGGIGGDYASVSALLSFDDATKRYLLQSEGSPRPWSGLATADIDLYQKAASISNKVTLKSPNALGASYTFTMPTALPASSKTIVTTSAGQLQYADTVTRTLVIPAAAAMNQAAATFTENAWASSTTPIIYPVTLPIGAVIVNWRVYIKKNSNNTVTLSAFLRKFIQDTPTNVNSGTNNGNSDGYHTITPGAFTQTTASTEQYDFQVSTSSGTADFFYQIEVDYQVAV